MKAVCTASGCLILLMSTSAFAESKVCWDCKFETGRWQSAQRSGARGRWHQSCGSSLWRNPRHWQQRNFTGIHRWCKPFVGIKCTNRQWSLHVELVFVGAIHMHITLWEGLQIWAMSPVKCQPALVIQPAFHTCIYHELIHAQAQYVVENVDPLGRRLPCQSFIPLHLWASTHTQCFLANKGSCRYCEHLCLGTNWEESSMDPESQLMAGMPSNSQNLSAKLSEFLPFLVWWHWIKCGSQRGLGSEYKMVGFYQNKKWRFCRFPAVKIYRWGESQEGIDPPTANAHTDCICISTMFLKVYPTRDFWPWVCLNVF